MMTVNTDGSNKKITGWLAMVQRTWIKLVADAQWWRDIRSLRNQFANWTREVLDAAGSLSLKFSWPEAPTVVSSQAPWHVIPCHATVVDAALKSAVDYKNATHEDYCNRSTMNGEMAIGGYTWWPSWCWTWRCWTMVSADPFPKWRLLKVQALQRRRPCCWLRATLLLSLIIIKYAY